MTGPVEKRGGGPVGLLTDLSGIEAASVIYLRLWCDGPAGKDCIQNDLTGVLGHATGRRAMQSFENLCRLCTEHGRRPLMRHCVTCKCLGADEACFANFVAAAATGDREDAMLIATLLVRADFAPLVTAAATNVGLTFLRMNLSTARTEPAEMTDHHARHSTLH